MSAREWQPGDVAMVRTREHGEQVGLRTSSPMTDGEQEFFVVPGFSYATDNQIRPLVVIDPEDREQVKRLAKALAASYEDDCAEYEISHMQTALREFANPTPPKPVEPQGLGAVVEDADGNKWVRTDRDAPAWTQWDASLTRLSYANVKAVRVLSEGVTA